VVICSSFIDFFAIFLYNILLDVVIAPETEGCHARS
jgi:hypothetical protein